MARLSKATIVVEAGETSGVVHQASECLKQNNKLIFIKSLAENKNISWVDDFIKSGAIVIGTSEELKEFLNNGI